MDYIGWLAHDGTHFPCNRYGHGELAIKLLKDFYNINTEGMKALVCDDMLIDFGWCRIGFSSFLSHGYTIQANWPMLSENQKAFIKEMYFNVKSFITEETINFLKDYGIIEDLDYIKKRVK